MIESIKGKITKEFVNKGHSSKLPRNLHDRTTFLLMALSDVNSFKDLKKICEPPSLRLHKLRGSLKEFCSITIAKPWCIIFRYKNNKFYEVEVIDYHD